MATHRASIVVVSGLVLGLAGRAASTDESPCRKVEPTPHRYVGAAACASQNCHGSGQRRGLSETSLQNEFLVWYQQDRHARAYTMLEGELGRRIGARLDPNEKVTESKRCRACHAPAVPGDATTCSERADCNETQDCDTKCRIRLRDGVTCEACHGPASAWLEPHTEKTWDASCSIPLGMRDTTRPEEAVQTCLDCHLGSERNPDQRVDHDLLAAGHPPLAFELDTFATDMPAHWARRPRNEAWFDGHAWAVGQVAAAQRAAGLFVKQMTKPGWPDFAAYDCQSCHHEISSGAWVRRMSKGRPTPDGARRPGMKAVVSVVARERGPAMHEAMEVMANAAAAGPGAPDVQQKAGKAADVMQTTTVPVLATVTSMKARDDLLRQFMLQIVELADETAGLGFRAAQQSAWALESLVDARWQLQSEKTKREASYPRLRAAIRRLYDALDKPEHYDPVRTEQRIRDVGAEVK
jgi:hypothetical protein